MLKKIRTQESTCTTKLTNFEQHLDKFRTKVLSLYTESKIDKTVYNGYENSIKEDKTFVADKRKVVDSLTS